MSGVGGWGKVKVASHTRSLLLRYESDVVSHVTFDSRVSLGDLPRSITKIFGSTAAKAP
jgi:hypothetical protein